MNKKILFTDMDGTLLQSDSTLSPGMKKGIQRLADNGHHLVLTSGRPLPSIAEVIKAQRLSLPGSLIIANNGSLIYDYNTGQPLLQKRIGLADVNYLLAKAGEAGIHAHVYTDTHIVAAAMNEELAYYTKRIHLPIVYSEDLAAVLPEGSYKIQCIHLSDHEQLEAFRRAIAPYCENRIQMIFSNTRYLELLPASAGKGNAVRYVCRHLGLPLSHAYAAGDAENDISMIKAAGHGIAMQNGDIQVKQAAEIITTRDNNHDGLLEIIDAYFSQP